MMTNSEQGELVLHVSGIVPADDFHPFVVGVARRLGLCGWVRHEAGGAWVRAVGTEEQLVQLVRAIRDDAPPSLRIRAMDPDAATADMPPVGNRFAALVDEDVEKKLPMSGAHPPLANVA